MMEKLPKLHHCATVSISSARPTICLPRAPFARAVSCLKPSRFTASMDRNKGVFSSMPGRRPERRRVNDMQLKYPQMKVSKAELADVLGIFL